MDAWLSGIIPVKDGVLAARGDRHGRVLRGWASALRGAAVSAVAAVGADYASVCETPPPDSWLGQEVQLALSVRGWLFVKTQVKEGRFTIEFDKGQQKPSSHEALPCLHAMRGLVKEAKNGPKGLGEVSLVQARFVLSETRTVTAVSLAKGEDDAVATLSSTPDDAVVLVDVCDGEHACACCGARDQTSLPSEGRALPPRRLLLAQVPGVALEEGPPQAVPTAPGSWGRSNFASIFVFLVAC